MPHRLAASTFALALATASCGAAEYTLGPQDKIRIKVFDWRANVGQTHEWTSLAGEYSVSASGAISLPLIGEVDGAGKTTAQIADAIGERLQASIGLTRKPVASVEVIDYRPYYILGAVDRPGQYPCRPGTSVMQAISSAGGLYRSRAATASEIENLRSELRINSAEKQNLELRVARLTAELDETQNLALPPAPSSPSPTANAARAQETEMFNVRRQSLAMQLDSLSRTKQTGEQEIGSLKAKVDILRKQADIAREQLQSVAALAAKGLAIKSRALELEQNASRYQSDILDVELTQMRANQEVIKIDSELSRARDTYRFQVLTELAEARSKALSAAAKVDAAKAALKATGESGSVEPPRLSISILRRVNGELRSSPAAESDEIAPGDLVKVYLDAGGDSVASASVR